MSSLARALSRVIRTEVPVIKRFGHALAQNRPPSSHQISLHAKPIKDDLEQFYSDEELNEFYQNLLLSESQPPQVQVQDETVFGTSSPSTTLPGPAYDTIQRLEGRFGDVHDLNTSLIQGMSSAPYQLPSLQDGGSEPGAQQPHHKLLHLLSTMIGPAETSFRESFPGANVAASSGASYQPPHSPSPLVLISYKEWFDLIRHSMHLGDVNSAQKCLSLMKQSAQQPPAGYYEFVLKGLAEGGRVSDVEGFLMFMRSEMGELTENAIHQHIKAYVRSRRLSEACSVIHSYEELHAKQNESVHNNVFLRLPSQKTYTLVISSLLAQNQAHSRAHAWDFFAHMRYVAHPTPDASLYATMLRACAYAPVSHAERALDLWTEMCVDNKISPTRDAYNALILACARASGADKHQLSHAHDAFRFAREMLEACRAGAGHLKPNVETFSALLESAKRSGDLARARWILAELAGSHAAGGQQGASELAPNQHVMAQIFQVYAAYQPPFSRRGIKGASRGDVRSTQDTVTGAPLKADARLTPTPTGPPGGSAVDVPQTHGEVVAEASALFLRILASHGSPPQSSEASSFSGVELTTHLFNSYLSVHFAHSSLTKSRGVYDEIFSDPGKPPHTNPPVRKNGRTLLLALQRCAHSASSASSQSTAKEAFSFAQAIWNEWINGDFPTNADMPSRTIEKMWSSMIRVLALSGNIDDAMKLMHDFGRRYPPHEIALSSSHDESWAPSESGVHYDPHGRTHLVHPPHNHTSSLVAMVDSSQPTADPPIPASSTATATATQLKSQALRPLVQLVSPTLVADPHIPPWLSFVDVEVLHQRLLALERWKDVGYITWLTRAYAGAVKKRRTVSLASLKGSNPKTRTTEGVID